MRRSAAPSQLAAKRGRFSCPLPSKNIDTGPKLLENTGDCHNLPQHSSPQPRSTQDILALFQSPPQSSPHQSSSQLSPAASVSLDATEILDGKENAAPTQPSASNDERYFSVVWCKRSTRKHKKWEGDAVLVVRSRSVVLKDTEGKVIGQSSGYKTADLASLDDGNTLVIGAKEIEVQGCVTPADYSSGRCFLSSAAPAVQAPQPPTVTARPQPKPFRLPIQRGQGTQKGGEGKPLYATDLPHTLVFPRPSLAQQFECPNVVDVVLDPLLSSRLRPHQRDGLLFLYRAAMAGKGCILADEMGLGKTVQCIALVWTLLKQSPFSGSSGGTIEKALILAPSSLTSNWAKEFNKWLGKEKLLVYTVDQNNKADDFFKQKLAPVMIISYDMFIRSHELLCRKGSLFGLLICDEAHRLKNSNSKTTSLLAAVPVTRRVLLTGTPLQNDLQELYALTNFATPGMLGSVSAFRRVYEDPIVRSRQANAGEEEKFVGKARVAELSRITSQFILRRTQEIIKKYLPPKVECVVVCSPSASQLSLYCQVADLVRHQVLSGLSGAGEDHLSAICLLRKLCNHPSLLAVNRPVSEDGPLSLAAEALSLVPPHLIGTFSEEDSGKLAVLSCLLYQLHAEGQEKIVVVSNFTSTLDMLEKVCLRYSYTFCRLDGSTPQIKRQAIVEKFNGPFGPDRIFLLSSKAGGVGLNLIGASRIVLYDIDWNPATDLQAMARVWRDGQTKPVYIYRLLLAGSVEERMFQRQVHKQGLSGAVVDTKSSSVKVTFSDEELKDLFSSRAMESALSLTHQQLECDCDLQGGNVRPRDGLSEGVRACQLTAADKTKGGQRRRMDELYQWQHFGREFISSGYLKDTCLEAGADFINMVFRNESALQPDGP